MLSCRITGKYKTVTDFFNSERSVKNELVSICCYLTIVVEYCCCLLLLHSPRSPLLDSDECFCRITDFGAVHLARAVAYNSSLQQLDLTNNFVHVCVPVEKLLKSKFSFRLLLPCFFHLHLPVVLVSSSIGRDLL